MQHVLIDVVHVFGVHSLHAWVEALQVAEQEPQSVPQLGDRYGQSVKAVSMDQER